MWSSGMTGEHNGARIGFDGLPAHIKIHVHERVTASDGDNPPDVLKKEDNNIYLPSVTDYEARRRHRQDNALYYAGLVLF